MHDSESLNAVCCLAGADSNVTVEEMQVLDGIVRRLGLEPKIFRASVAKTRQDEEYRQAQVEMALRDVEGSMRELIRAVRESGAPDEGHATMLLWRIATDQLQMSPDRFQSLLAGAPG